MARPRKGFAAHLDRTEIVIEPETPECCEGLERILIGEDVSERLDVTPARFRVLVTRRPKYAYRGRDGVIQTWATIATLLQTAKMNNVDPRDWLAQTLERIAQGWPLSQIDSLMPWNFKA